MNTAFEELAEYLLEGIIGKTLSDAVVYEFIVECYNNIQKESEIPWVGAVEELWNYLTISRTAPADVRQDTYDAFRQGQIFAALELVKMVQDRWESEVELKQDAKVYAESFYPVFVVLRNGKSLTYEELTDFNIIRDSLLLRYLHELEKKRYISCRKVGKTKYYRLCKRGQKLLNYMDGEQIGGGRNHELIKSHLYINAVLDVLPLLNMYGGSAQKSIYNDVVNSNYIKISARKDDTESEHFMIPENRYAIN